MINRNCLLGSMGCIDERDVKRSPIGAGAKPLTADQIWARKNLARIEHEEKIEAPLLDALIAARDKAFVAAFDPLSGSSMALRDALLAVTAVDHPLLLEAVVKQQRKDNVEVLEDRTEVLEDRKNAFFANLA